MIATTVLGKDQVTVFVLTDLMSTQICDEPSQFTEGERPRPQGSSPVEEFPEIEKYSESEVQSTNTDRTNQVKTINQRTCLHAISCPRNVVS